MTVESPIYLALLRLRAADIPAIDREMLRPAWAAIDEGRIAILPERVIARIRDLDARLPKNK